MRETNWISKIYPNVTFSKVLHNYIKSPWQEHTRVSVGVRSHVHYNACFTLGKSRRGIGVPNSLDAVSDMTSSPSH